MDLRTLGVKIFCDSANLADMREITAAGLVSGYTCNPSLCRKAGVTDYLGFCRLAATEFPALPLSLEVIADTPDEIDRQARVIAGLGANVYVKVPILNCAGDWNTSIIHTLAASGVRVNVTACLTVGHVSAAIRSLVPDVPSYVSVFAGRIADTGVNPLPTMRATVNLIAESKLPCEAIWASVREPFNLIQASSCDVQIITVFPEMLRKLSLFGKDLHAFALETSQMFARDAAAAGYVL